MSSNNAVKERIVGQEVKCRPEEPAVSPVQRPRQEEIRRRAFAIHIERGDIRGYDLDDWLQAEKEQTENLRFCRPSRRAPWCRSSPLALYLHYPRTAEKERMLKIAACGPVNSG
jgi:hypothetical protein